MHYNKYWILNVGSSDFKVREWSHAASCEMLKEARNYDASKRLGSCFRRVHAPGAISKRLAQRRHDVRRIVRAPAACSQWDGGRAKVREQEEAARIWDSGSS